MKKISVSVCIANYNGLDVVEACIDSVLNQSAISGVEIIVHDDASSDHSIDLILKKYPEIKLIKSETNVGFCLANIRMAERASGEYLLFLNNDAELFPDAIETLLTAAHSSTKATIFGLPQYDANTHEFIDCGAFIDPFFNAVPNRQLQKAQVAMIAGACLWIPKNLWVELGGFPDWFESMAEDLYLCCRARLAGYSVTALPTSGFYHRIGNSFGGGKIENNRLLTTFRRRRLTERNKLFTMLIIVPRIWLYLFSPVQVMLLMIEGALLALIKMQWRIWADIYAPLIYHVYAYRSRWLKLRYSAQQHKCISFKCWLLSMQWRPYKLQMLIKYWIPEIK